MLQKIFSGGVEGGGVQLPSNFEFWMIYCQAQSQLQLNWTELVLFSINAHKLHNRQHKLHNRQHKLHNQQHKLHN